MRDRLRILISQRIDTCKNTGETREGIDLNWFTILRRIFPYVELFPVPNSIISPQDLFHRINPHGLILTGGNDIGESTERDNTESTLVEIARSQDIPILGVCRGFQLLNVLFGGKIINNIHNQSRFGVHVASIHEVLLVYHSLNKYQIEYIQKVNSFHNQKVTGVLTIP